MKNNFLLGLLLVSAGTNGAQWLFCPSKEVSHINRQPCDILFCLHNGIRNI